MNISVMYSQAHYREILAANDAHQVCHSGHLDVHVCVFVCAVLFMLLFSLRDRLKRQEIKLMEANQSRGRRFRLKRPHPTRLGRSATLCRRACTYTATCMCGSLCLLACLRQQPAWPFPVYHLGYFAVLPLLQLIIYSLSRHSADQFNRGGKTGVRKWYF